MKTALFIIVNLMLVIHAHARIATWNLNHTAAIGIAPTNWTPANVPNQLNDVATFDVSNLTEISLSTGKFADIDRLVFNPGASAYTITCDGSARLGLHGKGIVNRSGITQTVHATGLGNQFFFALDFFGGSSAGSNTLFTTELDPSGVEVEIAFFDTSTAGESTFILNGAVKQAGTYEARCQFFHSSSAGHATFILQGGAINSGDGGSVNFNDTSSAGTATITSNGSEVSGGLGGLINFESDATAESSTLIANGGVNGGLGGRIFFGLDSTGDNARIRLNDTGTLDISCHNAPGMGIGSVEGNGLVILSGNALTVGGNGRDTTFSGTMRDDDGSCRGRGGSLVKVGSGRLTLTHKNFYTGGTTLLEGSLTVNNGSGSASGSGPVNVNAGALSGRGIIGGNVVIGIGAGGSGAFIAPSGQTDSDPGVLTIKSALTFDSDGQYQCGLNSTVATADRIVASGVTIDPAAQFVLADSGAGTLAAGTIFTVIDNTGATAINGAFSNLADGAIVTVNGNNLQASYSGGDGNDLTLTVVP